jgi:hypothetical protein
VRSGVGKGTSDPRSQARAEPDWGRLRQTVSRDLGGRQIASASAVSPVVAAVSAVVAAVVAAVFAPVASSVNPVGDHGCAAH